MTVAQFMTRAVSYYYATRDPFGVKGDFTTAPKYHDVWRTIGRMGWMRG